ncbi:MAG: hypothetical protein IJB10_04700 [Clostridia bacterium]|nr:hypothetical protein [Clostridia bacterium]
MFISLFSVSLNSLDISKFDVSISSILFT